MGFADSIAAFSEKALQTANICVNKAVESLFIDTVLLTPTSPEAKYATGLLINNWYPQIGTFDQTTSATSDYYGDGSLSRIKTSCAGNNFYGKDNVVTLTNSVDHAYRANYLGWPVNDNSSGWHWTGKVQAYGFVQKAVNNFIGKYM